MNNKETYKKMMDSLMSAIYETAKGGAGRWPQPMFKYSLEVSFYSAPYMVRDFMNITDKLLSQGLSFEDIGALYRYPSRLARLCHSFPSRKLWFIKPDEYIKVGYRIANILLTLYKENEFNYKGVSIIYKIEELLIRFPLLLKSNVFKNVSYPEIKKLSSGLWLLAESFFPRSPNTFFEFSGPYQLNNKFLIIKEFHDLKPDYLKINFHYNFNCLTIIEIYDSKPKISLDIMSRLTSNCSDSPKKCLVFIDDKHFTGNLNEIIMKVKDTLKESVGNLNELNISRNKIILFNARAEYFSIIKPIACSGYQVPIELIKSTKSESIRNKIKRACEWLDSVPKDNSGWKKIFSLSK